MRYYLSSFSVPIVKETLLCYSRGSLDDMQRFIVLSRGKLRFISDLGSVVHLVLEWMNV